MIEARGVNNLPKVVTRQCGGQGSNSRPLSHQSDALATRLSTLANRPPALLDSKVRLEIVDKQMEEASVLSPMLTRSVTLTQQLMRHASFHASDAAVLQSLV